MILHVLFGHRKYSLEDDLMPEVVVCWDEYCVDSYPEGFEEEVKKAVEGDEFIHTCLVEIEIDGDEVYKLMNEVPKLKGKMKVGESDETKER